MTAIICYVTLSFGAVGDKVYFVDSQSWGTVYVTEYDDLWNSTWGTAVLAGWQYEGKDVYEYTIQSSASTTIGVKLDDSHSTNPAIAIEADCYYLIDTDNIYYWLTKKYYNEYYFMDNNSTVFGTTPNIVLYNVDGSWEILNGSWPGAAMTSIGTITHGTDSYAGWKYVYLTEKECTNVNFNDGTTNWSVAVEIGKKYYSWGNWYTTINEIANPVQLVGDEAITSSNWSSLETNQMWWNSTDGVFTLTRNNVHITADDWYNFRVYLGTSGDNWEAAYPKAGNGYINLAPGVYSLYFTYNPATDVLTCIPTKVFSREVTNGNYGTICLPQESTSWTGATMYKVAGKELSGLEVVDIVLEEATWMEAGRPYIFKATSDWVNVWFNEEPAVDAPITMDNNGLVGSFTTQAIGEYDGSSCFNYILHDNSFYQAGASSSVGALRAYLDMNAVPTISNASLAPGKKYVRMSVDGKGTPTEIEGVESQESKVKSRKVLREGKLVIIREGEEYSVLGTRL
ncbi:MAG: hypothetical protein J5612_00330 [Paludibacteraceae bacterium]|nr:hypothetical protein [Paludibacteraceae bacterium]